MSLNLFCLGGKTALVTGASRGLGAGMAIALANAGAEVALHASSKPAGVTADEIQAFREKGFFRASEDHGPTAVFGGITRSLEMDREEMATRFRQTFEDIQSGGFARRFQEEARNGYPMLDFARAMMHGGSPMADAEERIRRFTAPDPSGPTAGGPA